MMGSGVRVSPSAYRRCDGTSACDEPRCLALGLLPITCPTDELAAYGTFGGWSGSGHGRRLDVAPKGKLRSVGRARGTDTEGPGLQMTDGSYQPLNYEPAWHTHRRLSHARFADSSRGGLH